MSVVQVLGITGGCSNSGTLRNVGTNLRSDMVLNAQNSIIIFFSLFINYQQLGRHPVAGVVTCYISTDYEDFTLKFRYGGLHDKHVVAT